MCEAGIPPGVQGRPPAEPSPRKMLPSLQSLFGERSPAGELFFLFRDWPCPRWGWGKPIKENPKTSLSAFTNYKGKLILAATVSANSGLSYLELNSTWKETLFFFSWGLKKGTEMTVPWLVKTLSKVLSEAKSWAG